ncbi:glycosyl transferase, group 1 family protein [Synechococcus sp. PCC 7335]|uniref:glycosyltransferase family 4 protein n=1 Tax=Synechococcus sp. (strain ATCC 29403 / PCC 7335) TaxID=91464 RepID=UPI00017EC045|nr:glycosyltransferase family 4 protein [Synechococcus sp. PCC 7335]EDX87622.1 glycosyl transferase, group 1 family protein [Synechococcus sp. PCC 7335]
MKVALLHFCFEDYSVELANGLAEYVDLTLIHPQNCTKACQSVLDPRIHLLSFDKPKMRDPRNLLSMQVLMRMLREVKPDVLHVQEINDVWYLMALLLKKMPPLITTIHDVLPHPGDRDTVFASQLTRRIAFYRSQRLIVHTQSLKQVLIEKFRIEDNRIDVLPHGELGSLYRKRAGAVSPREQHPNTPPAKEPYTLIFFGRIWPYKGLRYLLETLPAVIEKIPKVKLIIAGRGESLSNYFPDGYDDEHLEVFNDFIEDEDVVRLFQRATVTVLPYIESSQSGVAAISYGMGTPVIASNVGGLSEIVHHQKDGFLVPPRDSQALADTIIQLLSDLDLQQRMQAAALARCQNDLNWSKIAFQTVHLYQKIAAKSSMYSSAY